MDPIQALDMLNQVVKGVRLPYSDHVLLERSVDVLRGAIQNPESQTTADLLDTDEPVEIFEDESPVTKSKKQRRGGRRKK